MHPILYVSQTALELGFLYALVAMALFLSYRILDIADLTTDGCFVLGAAVSVTCAAAGHPILGIPAAMLAGCAAGFVTAFLQTRLGVPSILAGIVTNTGLYTVNLMAMGWSSNVSLLKQATVFTMFRDTGIGGSWYETVLAAFVAIAAGLLLLYFLGTRLGLSIRATGDNRDMVRASSINPTFTITIGLCMANALTALSGAMVGQYQKTMERLQAMIPSDVKLYCSHNEFIADAARLGEAADLLRDIIDEANKATGEVNLGHQYLEEGRLLNERMGNGFSVVYAVEDL